MGGCGEYQDFPSKLLCLAVPKKFVGQPFSVLLTSGIEKVCASEGYVTILRRKFFVPQYRNILKGTLLCCVSEKFCQRKCLWISGRGKYQDFPSKLLCPTVPKHFERNPSVLFFKNFLLTKKFMDDRVWGVS